MGVRTFRTNGIQLESLRPTKKAAELLAERGVIEIWPETKMYRIKQPSRK